MIEGLFVVLEGVDGAGTTTHTRFLVDGLRARGLPVHTTREPSDGPIGVQIRQVLTGRLVVPGIHGSRPPSWTTMALLFAADRLDHLDSLVIPALEDGSVVVSDRYDLSSFAYQSATSSDAPAAIPWIRELNSRAVRPDVTVVIDVPAEVAEERRRGRGGVEEMFEHKALQERLVSIYAKAETLVPGDRVVHVSGVGELDAVSARVLDAVREAVPALR